MLIHGPRAVATPRILSILLPLLLLHLASASSSRGDEAALEDRIAALNAEELPELLAEAEAGDAEAAQYLLGRSCHLGQAQPKNPPAAFAWYMKAAERGHALSAFRLSGMFRDGDGAPQDLGLAEEWLGKAGQHGHGPSLVAALYLLGLGVQGDDVAQDLALADDWLRKAAEYGHARSRYALGRVAEDHRQATAWFRLSAEQGFVMGQVNLASSYALGRGVRRDLVDA